MSYKQIPPSRVTKSRFNLLVFYPFHLTKRVCWFGQNVFVCFQQGKWLRTLRMDRQTFSVKNNFCFINERKDWAQGIVRGQELEERSGRGRVKKFAIWVAVCDRIVWLVKTIDMGRWSVTRCVYVQKHPASQPTWPDAFVVPYIGHQYKVGCGFGRALA